VQQALGRATDNSGTAISDGIRATDDSGTAISDGTNTTDDSGTAISDGINATDDSGTGIVQIPAWSTVAVHGNRGDNEVRNIARCGHDRRYENYLASGPVMRQSADNNFSFFDNPGRLVESSHLKSSQFHSI